MNMVRLAMGVVCLSLLASPLPAEAAGRKPYGGNLKIPLKHFGGIDDPHTATDTSGRLGALLAHCRLLRRQSSGRVILEAAQKLEWTKGGVELTLRPGARFHNGSPLRADDVMRSFGRLRVYFRTPEWIRTATAQINVLKVDARTIRIHAPTRLRKFSRSLIIDLLARPEMAILSRGRPGRGSGCGPFRAVRKRSNELRLVAHDGHPLGRPWLNTIDIKRYAETTEQIGAFRFRSLDLTFLASDRYKDIASQDVGSRRSVYLVLAPKYRQARYQGLRSAVRQALKGQSFADVIETLGIPVAGHGLWPRSLSISKAKTRRTGRWSPPAQFRLHYAAPPSLSATPSGIAKDTFRIATRVQDRLTRLLGKDRVTIHADKDVTLYGASRQATWDAAIVIYDWASTNRYHAALEARAIMKLSDFSKKYLWSGRLKRWAQTVDGENWLMPLVHLKRLVYSRKKTTIPALQGHPEIDASWVQK